MRKVRFFYADVPAISLRNKRQIQQFVEEIFIRENRSLVSLTYIFCSDGYILDINKRFLQHDYYTDIITFDLSEKSGTIGEVYISVETVRSNSIIHNTTWADELLRVIFHGALHLCGYGDKTKSEITIMRQKEEYFLHSYLENI